MQNVYRQIDDWKIEMMFNFNIIFLILSDNSEFDVHSEQTKNLHLWITNIGSLHKHS